MRKVFCEITGQELSLPDEVNRIVSLSPAVTETLFMLGLGDRIVGVTAFDVHPEEARKKPIIASYNRVSMNRLRELKPDIIFAVSGYQRKTATELSRQFPVYMIELPASVASIMDMVVKVGIVTGNVDEARSLSKELLRRLYEVHGKLKGKVYVEIDLGGPVTFGSYSYITDGLDIVGLRNIFSDHMVEWEEPDFQAVHSADPDFIIYEPKMFRPMAADEVFRKLRDRGWGDMRSRVLVTPGPYDFLAHHGPSFITTVLPWIVENAPNAQSLDERLG